MPVKFGQTSIRCWFFLSYLITTVKKRSLLLGQLVIGMLRIPEHRQSLFTKTIPASIIHAFVGIALFGINTSVLLNVFESKVHKTAIAAMVAVTGRAINQVLLAQRNKFSCFT